MEATLQKIIRMHKTRKELEALLNTKVTSRVRGGKIEYLIDKKALLLILSLKNDAKNRQLPTEATQENESGSSAGFQPPQKRKIPFIPRFKKHSKCNQAEKCKNQNSQEKTNTLLF